jgi:hypothetical protein
MKKIIVPKFNIDNNFIGYKIVMVSNKMTDEDQEKVRSELPGIPQGFCPALGRILITKKPIEITRFYDSRQRTKKLKNLYISLVI